MVRLPLIPAKPSPTACVVAPAGRRSADRVSTRVSKRCPPKGGSWTCVHTLSVAANRALSAGKRRRPCRSHLDETGFKTHRARRQRPDEPANCTQEQPGAPRSGTPDLHLLKATGAPACGAPSAGGQDAVGPPRHPPDVAVPGETSGVPRSPRARFHGAQIDAWGQPRRGHPLQTR